MMGGMNKAGYFFGMAKFATENSTFDPQVLEFFDKNRKPTDDEVHDWSEEHGKDTDKVEQQAYNMAGKFVSFWNHGKSEEAGMTPRDVDKDELDRGVEVEMEHTDDPEVSKWIGMDHLSEIKDYYTRLDKMEEEAKEEGAEVGEEKKAFAAGYFFRMSLNS